MGGGGGLSPGGAGHARLAFVSPALGESPSPRRPGRGPVLTWPVNNSQIRVGAGRGECPPNKGLLLHLTVIRAGEAHKSRRGVTRRGCKQARVSVCVHVCGNRRLRACFWRWGNRHFGLSTFKLREAFVGKKMLNKTSHPFSPVQELPSVCECRQMSLK